MRVSKKVRLSWLTWGSYSGGSDMMVSSPAGSEIEFRRCQQWAAVANSSGAEFGFDVGDDCWSTVVDCCETSSLPQLTVSVLWLLFLGEEITICTWDVGTVPSPFIRRSVVDFISLIACTYWYLNRIHVSSETQCAGANWPNKSRKRNS